MSDFVDLNEISSQVSSISLQFPRSQCPEYRRTMEATDHILTARDAADESTRNDHLQRALDAMADARPEVPDDLDEGWQACIDALEEAMNDE